MKYIIAAIISSFLLFSCSNNTHEDEKLDPHSYSNHHEVVTTHMNLDLNVNFENKQIEGKASLKIENRTQTDSIILDTYELAIEKVTLGSFETMTPLPRRSF